MGNLGEWLNGRVVVSKTIGCVFESRLPCHKKRTGPPFFFCGRGNAIAFASFCECKSCVWRSHLLNLAHCSDQSHLILLARYSVARFAHSLRIAWSMRKNESNTIALVFVEAEETRLHSQVFANAKVACDARSRYDMRLASTALDAPLSLAIPSLALLAPYDRHIGIVITRA